jgi:hypothetical protein
MANEDKNISYLNKDFGDFKSSLQQYAKTYFPNTYNDFSEATPGNMFIEMASYVGDVMSFYLDTQVQENFLLYAKEKENLYAQAYVMGYRPKASYASNTTVDVYQLVPSIISGGNISPDFTAYGTLIPANTIVTSTSTGTKFLTTQQIDFRDTGSTEITFVDTNYYLFKKSVPVISAEIKEISINVGTNQKFATSTITDTNILQILSVTGSGGANDIWYEVPYLAQSSIFQQIANPTYNTDQVPYLLQLQRVPKRFVSRILSDDTLQLEFGAGLSQNKTDTQIIPTPSSIQSGSIPGISLLTNNYNEASTFFTQEYGLVPNGSLLVKYLVGGGITSNVPANDLTIIDTTNVTFPGGGGALNNDVLQSIISSNPNPSSGGRNGDTVDEVRQNALYSFSTQLRAVTKDDYIVRALSMPSDYGTVAKAYISQDLNTNPQETVAHTNPSNSLALDLYILSYNSNKQLTVAAPTLKQNLVTYLNQYRMVTDAINIKDAYYINIGFNFDITVVNGYSNKDVITNCISVLKDYFNIDKWQINQPITLSDIQSRLLQIRGVQSVVKLEVVNKQSTLGNNTYSQYGYDIAGATKNGNIYPSLDPAIFEVRFPDVDIQGRVVVS